MVRGILTDTDRQWLRGEIDYASETTDLDRVKKIRDRAFQALLDFQLLDEGLSQSERKKIFDRLADESESQGADEVSSVIEFLYKGLSDRTKDPQPIAEGPDEDLVARFTAFRKALTMAIGRGKSEYSSPQSTIPDIVTLAANTELFEFPEKDEVRSCVDTDKWKDVNKKSGGGIGEYDDVAFFLQMMIQYRIHERISGRHQTADEAIKNYDQFKVDSSD